MLISHFKFDGKSKGSFKILRKSCESFQKISATTILNKKEIQRQMKEKFLTERSTPPSKLSSFSELCKIRRKKRSYSQETAIIRTRARKVLWPMFCGLFIT